MPAKSQSRQTLAWLLVPMLATFALQRAYLHFIDPSTDVFIAGHNVHHLFVGALIEIAAGIMLAFGLSDGIPRRIAWAAFGIGSAMVLDEIVYLIATDGSNAAYLTPISLWGAVILISLAAIGIFVTHRLHRRN